jgi:hypothetical protein
VKEIGIRKENRKKEKEKNARTGFGPNLPSPTMREAQPSSLAPIRARILSCPLSVAWGHSPARVFNARVSLMGGPGSSEAPSPLTVVTKLARSSPRGPRPPRVGSSPGTSGSRNRLPWPPITLDTCFSQLVAIAWVSLNVGVRLGILFRKLRSESIAIQSSTPPCSSLI